MSRPPNEELRRGSRELKEALEHVGVLMQLPPKQPTAELPTPKEQSARERAQAAAAAIAAGNVGEPAGPTDNAFRPNRAARFLPAIAILLLIVVGGIYMLPDSSVELPDAVVGKWESQHPQYRGSGLAFTKTTVALRAKQDAPEQVYEIARVKTVRLGDSTKVVVTYRDGGGEIDLEFALLGRDKPVIWFARPAGLSWSRTGP